MAKTKGRKSQQNVSPKDPESRRSSPRTRPLSSPGTRPLSSPRTRPRSSATETPPSRPSGRTGSSPPGTPSSRHSGRSRSTPTGRPSLQGFRKRKTTKTTLNPIERNKHKKRVTMLLGSKSFQISTNVLKEIKFYQLSTTRIIPKAPFSRVVHEIMSDFAQEGCRIQSLAIEALQESVELYLTQYFEDSNICAMHARRSTLLPRDMHVTAQLRRRMCQI